MESMVLVLVLALAEVCKKRSHPYTTAKFSNVGLMMRRYLANAGKAWRSRVRAF
jgi:hypothetical protein